MTNSEHGSAKIKMWLAEPLPKDVDLSLQRLATAEDIQHVAVMPDVHLAGDVCNGTVIATKELVYPAAVGSDIGCGMLAVSFDLGADAVLKGLDAGQILGELYQRIPSKKHARMNCLEHVPDSLTKSSLSDPKLDKLKNRDGLFQLGTLGRGNHFVEFQSDVPGRLWLMVHSGSRGMGQAITEHHLRTTRMSRAGIGYVDVATAAGQAYLSDVNWAIEYAMQNRLAMACAVEALVQKLFEASADWSTLIHSHHNHVRRETHFGSELWVHRKGALPAEENVPGLIPGSMGTHSYHVAGRGLDDALKSSSHGAGRRLPRHLARRQISHREFEYQMRGIVFDRRRIDNLCDEAPGAYKDIGRVMRAQRELTRIVSQLRPLLVYKGG